MEDKKTRVEISAELRELINDYIEEQKTNGVKGLSQIKVLDQLCRAGLSFQKQTEIGGVNTSESIGVRQPFPRFPNEYVPEKKSELKAMQKALYEKEHRLIEKEQFLLDKEVAINNKHYKALGYYEKSFNKQPDPVKSFTDQMKLDDKFKNIERSNENIRDDISSMKKELLRTLREIKLNTNKDMMFDKVLPMLTTLGVSFNTFQQLTKGKNFKIDTFIKDMVGNLGKQPNADKGTITKESKESA